MVTDAGLKGAGAHSRTPPPSISLLLDVQMDARLKELAALKNLTNLDISSTGVTDAGMKELAAFKNLTNSPPSLHTRV